MDKVLENIIHFYKSFEQVKAIAFGGSSSAKTSDKASDIDLYVFLDKDIPVEDRRNFVEKISSKFEVGGEYFGNGDEYFVDELGQQLDVMYWNTNWFEDVVENTWIKNYVQNGYTTCYLYTLNIFDIVYDKDNWLQGFKEKINTPYPNKLKQNIIKRSMMLMKDKPFASYYEQIEKALKRNDVVSVNHRLSAFIASYFDVIFAVNEKLHCGEKRLIKYAKDNLKILPKDFEENLEKVLKQPNEKTLDILSEMVENLRAVL